MMYNDVYSPNVGLTSRASFEPSLARVSPEPSLALLAAILKIRNPSRTRTTTIRVSRAVVFSAATPSAAARRATDSSPPPPRSLRTLPRGARRSPPTLSTSRTRTRRRAISETDPPPPPPPTLRSRPTRRTRRLDIHRGGSARAHRLEVEVPSRAREVDVAPSRASPTSRGTPRRRFDVSRGDVLRRR